MKKVYLTTFLACAFLFLTFGLLFSFGRETEKLSSVKVGFIYENDGSTPYSYNFGLAEDSLREAYPDRVEIYSCSNVRNEETKEPLLDLIHKGCGIIFTDGYSDEFRAVAAEYPEIQFCQASYLSEDSGNLPENYHTFKGKIYQGRYVSGIAAGMKLNEMIANKVIKEEEALVGYVAAFPSEEVISGFTAFLLGIRSVCPSAVMKVRYTNSWGSFSLEKETAARLIEEGCRVIGQHTDTIGPALACERVVSETPVCHVGYNMSMIGVAPASSLVSTCINWNPYVVGAVGAVLDGKKIEDCVDGIVNGNDMCAGFEHEWVEMLELNNQIAAYDTAEKMSAAVEALKKNRIQVFKGDYIGVNPEDANDVYDLNKGYEENKEYSSPTFHYILKDVIEIEK